MSELADGEWVDVGTYTLVGEGDDETLVFSSTRRVWKPKGWREREDEADETVMPTDQKVMLDASAPRPAAHSPRAASDAVTTTRIEIETSDDLPEH